MYIAVVLTLPERKFKLLYIAIALTLPESKFRLLYIAVALTLPESNSVILHQNSYNKQCTLHYNYLGHQNSEFAVVLTLPERKFRLLYIAVALTLHQNSEFDHVTLGFFTSTSTPTSMA